MSDLLSPSQVFILDFDLLSIVFDYLAENLQTLVNLQLVTKKAKDKRTTKSLDNNIFSWIDLWFVNGYFKPRFSIDIGANPTAASLNSRFIMLRDIDPAVMLLHNLSRLQTFALKCRFRDLGFLFREQEERLLAGNVIDISQLPDKCITLQEFKNLITMHFDGKDYFFGGAPAISDPYVTQDILANCSILVPITTDNPHVDYKLCQLDETMDTYYDPEIQTRRDLTTGFAEALPADLLYRGNELVVACAKNFLPIETVVDSPLLQFNMLLRTAYPEFLRGELGEQNFKILMEQKLSSQEITRINKFFAAIPKAKMVIKYSDYRDPNIREMQKFISIPIPVNIEKLRILQKNEQLYSCLLDYMQANTNDLLISMTISGQVQRQAGPGGLFSLEEGPGTGMPNVNTNFVTASAMPLDVILRAHNRIMGGEFTCLNAVHVQCPGYQQQEIAREAPEDRRATSICIFKSLHGKYNTMILKIVEVLETLLELQNIISVIPSRIERDFIRTGELSVLRQCIQQAQSREEALLRRPLSSCVAVKRIPNSCCHNSALPHRVSSGDTRHSSLLHHSPVTSFLITARRVVKEKPQHLSSSSSSSSVGGSFVSTRSTKKKDDEAKDRKNDCPKSKL